jgi:hypothetical protein
MFVEQDSHIITTHRSSALGSAPAGDVKHLSVASDVKAQEVARRCGLLVGAETGGTNDEIVVDVGRRAAVPCGSFHWRRSGEWRGPSAKPLRSSTVQSSR